MPGVDDDLDEEKRCYEGLGDFLEVSLGVRATLLGRMHNVLSPFTVFSLVCLRHKSPSILPRDTSWNPKQETRNQIYMEMACAFRFWHVDDRFVFQDIARQEVNDLGEGSDDVRLSVVFFPQIGYLIAIPASDGPQENELLGLQVLHFQSPWLCVSCFVTTDADGI